MDLQTIVSQMLVLFLALAVGYIACKARLMDSVTSEKLSKLVVNITNPAMILYSVMEGERTLTTAQVFSILGIAVVTYAFLYLAALVTPKLLRTETAQTGVYRFMVMFGNVGFMGFPVVRAMFGAEAVFYASVFNMPFNVLSYTVGAHWVSGGKAGKQFDWKLLLGPNIIASVVTFGLYLTNLRLPQVIVSATGMLSDMTTPAAMMIIGCSLGQMHLREVLGDWRIYGMCALKLLVLPIFIFLVLSRFESNLMILGIVVVIAAMPVGTSATMLCYAYGGDQRTASKGVFLSTILSMVTIPALMWLLFIR